MTAHTRQAPPQASPRRTGGGTPLARAHRAGRKYGKPWPAEISWSSPVAQPPDLAFLFAGTVKLAAEIANAASA